MKMRLVFLLMFLLYSIASSQLQSPESAVWNDATNSYIISDAAQGKLISMTIDGNSTDFTTGLNSPKGIASGFLSLWVTDVNRIVEIDMLTGTILATYPITGATFLNDIVSDDFGYLYISDTQSNAIFEFDELTGEYSEFTQSNIPMPNGMHYDIIGGLIVVSFQNQQAKIFTVDLEQGNVNELMQTNLGQLDGICFDTKRNRYYISSWSNNAIYIFEPSFTDTPELLLDGLNGPADIYYDELQDILVIPVMNESRVIFYDFSTSSVEGNNEEYVKVYPNPVERFLHIDTDIVNYNLTIYNAKGDKYYSGENPRNLDLKYLAKGTYFLNFNKEKNNFIKKIIKK